MPRESSHLLRRPPAGPQIARRAVPRTVSSEHRIGPQLTLLHWCIVVAPFDGHGAGYFDNCRPDSSLTFEFYRVVEDGEFWDSFRQVRNLQQVPLAVAVPNRIGDICDVLRNGFAHFHWHFQNLSGQDYWSSQGWDITQPQPVFNLSNRPEDNYRAYIVDATPPWTPSSFWDMPNLRILVTSFGTLRYHLHRFLNIVLNDSHNDVFSY